MKNLYLFCNYPNEIFVVKSQRKCHVPICTYLLFLVNLFLEKPNHSKTRTYTYVHAFGKRVKLIFSKQIIHIPLLYRENKKRITQYFIFIAFSSSISMLSDIFLENLIFPTLYFTQTRLLHYKYFLCYYSCDTILAIVHEIFITFIDNLRESIKFYDIH